MRYLARYFFRGLILVVPVALTAYVLYASFTSVDTWLDLTIPGLGVLAVLVAITLIGLLASWFVLQPLVRLLESAIERLPFVKLLYGAVKDLLKAVVGDDKRFDKPVLVELTPGVRALGFLTCEDLSDIGLPDHALVYLPQSYNFAGQSLVVDRDHLTVLDAPSSSVMTLVVSAGVTSGKGSEPSPEALKKARSS